MTASISARTIDALTAIATGLHDIADAVRETGRAGEGRIATQEPAGEPAGGSGGRGASGGLGERLRALAADMTEAQFTAAIIGQMADEADRLEGNHRRQRGTIAAQKERTDRVRAQLVRMTKSSDEKTVRHGNALLRILDDTGEGS